MSSNRSYWRSLLMFSKRVLHPAYLVIWGGVSALSTIATFAGPRLLKNFTVEIRWWLIIMLGSSLVLIFFGAFRFYRSSSRIVGELANLIEDANKIIESCGRRDPIGVINHAVSAWDSKVDLFLRQPEVRTKLHTRYMERYETAMPTPPDQLFTTVYTNIQAPDHYKYCMRLTSRVYRLHEILRELCLT